MRDVALSAAGRGKGPLPWPTGWRGQLAGFAWQRHCPRRAPGGRLRVAGLTVGDQVAADGIADIHGFGPHPGIEGLCGGSRPPPLRQDRFAEGQGTLWCRR